MADTLLEALTQVTSPLATDVSYLVRDPAGAPVDRYITDLDKLGILLAAGAVSVNGATTATVGRLHLCEDAGSPADYTLGLPAVSGNAGKLVGVMLDAAMTKLVTLDGNSAETIDGATTRILHGGESALLYCDGVTWRKLAGRTIPLTITAARTGSDQSTTGGVWTDVVLNNFVAGHASMWDSGNGWVEVARPGRYAASGFIYAASVSGYGYMTADFSSGANVFQQIVNAGGILSGTVSSIIESAAVGDHFTLSLFTPNAATVAATTAAPKMSLVEIPSW